MSLLSRPLQPDFSSRPYTRSATDATTASDSAAGLKGRYMTAADTAAATDVVLTGVVHNRTASDSATASDSNTSLFNHRRTQSDSAPAVDSGTPATLHQRNTLESIQLVADTAARTALLHISTTGDTAHGTDAATRSQNLARSLSVSIPIGADTATRGVMVAPRNVSDSANSQGLGAYIDSPTQFTAHIRTANDIAWDVGSLVPFWPQRRTLMRAIPTPVFALRASTGISDVAVAYHVTGRLGADSAPATDGSVKSVNNKRAMTETLVTGDAARRSQNLARSPSDVANGGTVTDSSFRVLAASTTFTGSITASLSQPASSFIRYAQDAATASDQGHVPAHWQGTASDSAHATDFASRTVVLAASTTYSGAITASLTTSRGYFLRESIDALPTATDSATAWTLHTRAVTDQGGGTDAVSRQPNFQRSTSELVHGTDSWVVLASHFRAVTDAAPSADSLVRTAGYHLTAADAIPTATDAPTRQAVYLRNAVGGDTAHATDSGQPATIHTRSSSDALPTPTDVGTRQVNYISGLRFASDALTTFDTLAASSAVHARSTTDSAPSSDGLYVPRNVRITRATFGEALATADFPNAIHIFNRDTADGVNGFFDQVTVHAAWPRSATDSAPASDANTHQTAHIINLFESYAIAESLTYVASRSRSASDTAQTTPATDIFHPNDIGTAYVGALRRASENVGGITTVVTRFVAEFRNQVEAAGGTDVATLFQQVGRFVHDDISTFFGDTAVRRVFYGRSTADAAPSSELLTQDFVLLLRHTSEALPAVTDVATRGQAVQPRTASDVAHATDVAVQGTPRTRTAADSAPASDVSTRLVVYLRRGDEVYYLGGTFGGVDVATRVVAEARAGGDAASATDAAQRQSTRARASSDTTTISDASVRVVVNFRVVTDGQPTTDQANVTAGQQRSGADTATSADSSTRTWTGVRTAVDATSIGDAASRVGARARTSNDSAPALESGVRVVVYGRAMGDTAAGRDNWLVWSAHSRFTSDATTTSDTLRIGYPGRAADAAHATDAVTDWTNFARAATESIPIFGETASGSTHAVFNGSEIAFVSDVVIGTTARVRTTHDILSTAESASGVLAVKVRFGVEAAAASDVAATQFRGFLRSTSEALSSTDAASVARFLGRLAVDALTYGEQVSRQAPKHRSTSDTAPATEAVNAGRTFFRSSNDYVYLGDVAAVTAGGHYWRTGTDTAGGHETVQRVRTFLRSTADAVTGSDLLTHVRTVVRSVSEATTLAEDVVRVLYAKRRASDNARARESIRLASVLARNVTEALRTAHDSVRSTAHHLRSASDDTSISDAVTWLRGRLAIGVEHLTTADGAVREIDVTRSAHEAHHTFDGARRRTFLGRAGDDAAPAVDVGTHTPRLIRSTDDSAPAIDHEIDLLHTNRHVSEHVPTREAAVRRVVMERVVPDAAPAIDTGTRVPGISRFGFETYVTSDLAVGDYLHVVPFGPPVVVTLDLDRPKVSGVPGCNHAVVTFAFDQPVDRWYVRAERTGVQAASYEGVPVTEGSAEIDADVLAVGANTLTISARSPRGEWSRPV